MGKRDLALQVVRGAREYSIGTVLFHQAVGQVLGVNVTDMKCLDIMTLKGSASPSELAEHTGLSTGATTAMIDRLEKAGLVARRPHPTDRRSTIVVLSKGAMRQLPAMFEPLANAMQALVSSYSEKELRILADFFARVVVLWKEERGGLQKRYADRAQSGKTLRSAARGRAISL
jgi:DNA-binding MarR family transcriptional regulator